MCLDEDSPQIDRDQKYFPGRNPETKLPKNSRNPPLRFLIWVLIKNAEISNEIHLCRSPESRQNHVFFKQKLRFSAWCRVDGVKNGETIVFPLLGIRIQNNTSTFYLQKSIFLTILSDSVTTHTMQYVQCFTLKM
jgi:hypothetical protein